MKRNYSTKTMIVVFLVVVLQSFFVLSLQADNLIIPRDRLYWKDLEIESRVSYPEGWFFTLDQMDTLYEIEYNEGKRLTNFIRRENGKFLTQCNSKSFEVPEDFVLTTLHHLQEMLDNGHARYLFRLDAFHGHPFVSDQQFAEKYQGLSMLKMIKTFIYDRAMGILYHTSEHLALRNPPETGPVDSEAQKLIQQRNILGWFDGRPLAVLLADPSDLVGDGKSNTAIIPRGYRGVGSLIFKATKNGELSINKDDQAIRVDISLYDCYYH